MFRVTKVVTASEQEWNGWRNQHLLFPSVLFPPPFPKPKLDLLFGSRSREDRGAHSAFPFLVQFPVPCQQSPLNLGWPSSIPTEGCLAEKGEGAGVGGLPSAALSHSCLSPSSLSVLQQREGNKIKNTPFSSKRQEFCVQQAADTASLASVKLATKFICNKTNQSCPVTWTVGSPSPPTGFSRTDKCHN